MPGDLRQHVMHSVNPPRPELAAIQHRTTSRHVMVRAARQHLVQEAVVALDQAQERSSLQTILTIIHTILTPLHPYLSQMAQRLNLSLLTLILNLQAIVFMTMSKVKL